MAGFAYTSADGTGAGEKSVVCEIKQINN